MTLEGLSARHGGSLLTIGQGLVYVAPEGGFWAELVDLEGNPLVPDAELLHALPGAVSKICENLDLKIRSPFAPSSSWKCGAPTVGR